MRVVRPCSPAHNDFVTPCPLLYSLFSIVPSLYSSVTTFIRILLESLPFKQILYLFFLSHFSFSFLFFLSHFFIIAFLSLLLFFCFLFFLSYFLSFVVFFFSLSYNPLTTKHFNLIIRSIEIYLKNWSFHIYNISMFIF